MANRPLAQRTETDVVLPDDHKAEMWKAGANVADGLLDLKKKQDEANMNNFAASAQLDMMKTTNEWRIANEGNPTDQKAIDSLHQAYDNTLNQYDDKVGFLSRGAWSQVKDKIKNGYKEQNATWGFKQSSKNAVISVNSSIKTNLQIASEYGRSGDIKGALQHYDNSSAGLDAYGNSNLGPQTTAELTKDFKSDYMKSFLLGQAEQNPDATLTMLEDEKIRADIGNEKDVITLKAFATKQKNLIEKASVEMRNVSINSEYLNIVQGKSSFEKIDQGVIENKYNAKDAQFLKGLLVKVEPKKDDKLTIARYLDALSNLPIDSKEEAQAVLENIMGDSSIKDDTKAILLYGKKMGGSGKDAYSLSDISGGNVEVSDGRNFFMPWTWFKNVNTSDAVDAFIKFKKDIQGDETTTMLRKKAQRAISDVVIEKNSNLAELGQDWTGMVDGNGTSFMARMNEDGEIETLLSSDSNDTNKDEDVDNGD